MFPYFFSIPKFTTLVGGKSMRFHISSHLHFVKRERRTKGTLIIREVKMEI